MREAKSIKHFKSMLMQFFTLFSMHDQIAVNYLQGYNLNLVT